jgi:hypothetical protein
MIKLEIFDPPMCCSSGVCGPKIDPVLPRFTGDLVWFKAQGVSVTRYNLAQQPMAFAEHSMVREALEKEDVACLPLILVDGIIVSRGTYPERDALAALLGLHPVSSTSMPAAEKSCCCCGSSMGSSQSKENGCK